MSDIVLTLQWVADVTAGHVAAGARGAVIGEVNTDSRTFSPGEFFVALRGPRHDGHDYVQAVLARGASGALVDREWLDGPGAGIVQDADRAGLVVVESALEGLQGMARALRRRAQTRVVAITGSAGKTTTKDTIANMLGTRHRVVKNRGNLNNHIGLPLSLMELRKQPDVAVMELGMNHAREISLLVDIADPDVRVWTNVGDAHLGFFDSPEDIADAKAELLEGSAAGDVLVCNADDARVMARVNGFPGRTVTFGYSAAADIRAVDVEDLGTSGMQARLVTPDGERDISTGLLGRANLANVLAAAGVALQFGIPLDAIAAQAASARPAARRGAVHTTTGGVTVVDDSYNSSPAALRQALDVLVHDGHAGRRVAVLGEMLELGVHAEALHRACGAAVVRSGVTLLVTVGGPAAAAMADAAIGAGLPAEAVTCLPDSATAATFAAAHVRPGDLVLVKGSRGVRTDLVVDRLIGAGS